MALDTAISQHPCAVAWRGMVDSSRLPDSGLWVDAPGIMRAVGATRQDHVGLFYDIGTHRDADTVQRSNHAVAVARLWQLDPSGDYFTVQRWHHPLVGWIEHTFVNLTCVPIAEYASSVAVALRDYPVLDEMHWGELEWEANHPENDPYCYDDYQPCECGRPSAHA